MFRTRDLGRTDGRTDRLMTIDRQQSGVLIIITDGNLLRVFSSFEYCDKLEVNELFLSNNDKCDKKNIVKAVETNLRFRFVHIK